MEEVFRHKYRFMNSVFVFVHALIFIWCHAFNHYLVFYHTYYGTIKIAFLVTMVDTRYNIML